MRNGDDSEYLNDDEAIPDETVDLLDEENEPPAAVERAAPARPWRRRKYQVAAAIGVVAAVGAVGAGVVVAGQLLQQESTTVGAGSSDPAANPEAPADAGGPGGSGAGGSSTGKTGAPGGSGSAGGPSRSGAGQSGSGQSASSSSGPGQGGQGGPAGQAAGEPAPQVEPTVTYSGDIKKDGRSLRVVTALGNLSGQRELAWAADEGRRVGDASCTNNFRFNSFTRSEVKKTMLLCWRLSDTKSVYTLAVNIKGSPSEAESVAAIDNAWSKLG